MTNRWNVTLDEDGALSGQQAFELYKQGVEVWNEFMDQNPETFVDFSEFDFSHHQESDEISFSCFRFPNGVSFEHTHFGNVKALFDYTYFGKGKVSFLNAKFGNADVSFLGAVFNGHDISFRSTKFGNGNISFECAKFRDGNILFPETQFGNGDISFTGIQLDNGNIVFDQTNFSSGTVNFNRIQCRSIEFAASSFNQNSESDSKTIFSMERAHISKSLLLPNLDFTPFNSVSFRGTSIGTLFDIEGSQFSQLPDLTATTINGHFSVDRIHVDTPKTFTEGDATKARRLKELAKKSEDRITQLNMLALELDALSALKKWWSPYRWLNFLYSLISDYGRSILRPTIALLLVFSLCTFLYISLSDKKNVLTDATQLSLAQSMPFLSLSRTVTQTSLTTLYSAEEAKAETKNENPKAPLNNNWVESLGLFQNLLSYICLFFIGLGIRNRFKL